MKVIYELDTSSEQHDKWLFDNATKMYLVLSDILKQAREWNHYDERGSIPNDEIKDTIHKIFYDNNLCPDELL